MLVKAAVGHTLGGCVLVETAASLLALEHGRIPPLVGCDDADPRLPLGPRATSWNTADWVLLKCTNGFAGQNGAIVLAAPGTS